ncbi:TIGR04222 domain-containing membrane protein, partial [Sphingomonas sp. AOB5]|uniref:TIGR04222 domain-containing membrane protein n=1 Tax=Sphingomonas sp. AOB5 TaxID=3034017 RepID=UPI0023F82354
MSLGPFDLAGGPFLILYGGLLVLTIILGLLIPRWLRPDGRSFITNDPDELAWLAGGKARFANAVVARLLAARALFLVGKNKFQPDPHHLGSTPAERSVLALTPPAKWNVVERAIEPHADPIRRRLISSELLMDGGTALQLRFWQTTPYLLLLLFGAIKLEVGLSRDRPVGYLTLLMILTAILALVRFAVVDRRTKGGQAALADARRSADRLR